MTNQPPLLLLSDPTPGLRTAAHDPSMPVQAATVPEPQGHPAPKISPVLHWYPAGTLAYPARQAEPRPTARGTSPGCRQPGCHHRTGLPEAPAPQIQHREEVLWETAGSAQPRTPDGGPQHVAVACAPPRTAPPLAAGVKPLAPAASALPPRPIWTIVCHRADARQTWAALRPHARHWWIRNQRAAQQPHR